MTTANFKNVLQNMEGSRLSCFDYKNCKEWRTRRCVSEILKFVIKPGLEVSKIISKLKRPRIEGSYFLSKSKSSLTLVSSVNLCNLVIKPGWLGTLF
jgi:hypothetical protein